MKNKMFLAVILILIGTGLFLEQLSFLNFGDVFSNWWPILIVLLGVFNLSKSKGSIMPGLIMILIGLLLLGDALNILSGGFWSSFWPLVLIVFGVWLLLGRKKIHLKDQSINESFPRFNTVFSGSKHVIDSPNFEGAEVITMFGGTTIDLRRANIGMIEAVMDISVSFGGVEIWVPDNWKIVTSGSPIFGAFENKIRNNNANDDSPVLHIKYFVIFGGIEIKG